MRGKAIYKALLRCYPGAFRQEYGTQMLLTFAEQLGEARRTGGRRQQAAVWRDAVADVLSVAPQEHGHVILQDLRYAFRSMAAHPGFTAIAILSLALGIGANTAIFSLWNGVLYSSLPLVNEPGKLVMLTNPDATGDWHGSLSGERAWLSYPEFADLRENAASFAELMAVQSDLDDGFRVRASDGSWEPVRGRLVSGDYFEVLGVEPELGRGFTRADEQPGSAPYAVISHGYWQRKFGGRSDVLGQPLVFRGATLTVIGVAPRGFIGETNGQQADLWVPLGMQAALLPGDDRLHDTPPSKWMWLHVFGRLKPGVSDAQAEAEANTLFRTGLESFYGGIQSQEQRARFLNQRLGLHPAGRGVSSVRGSSFGSLTALLAAVGVLLLIACANLANLLLARGAARRPEMAVRMALGASRAQLMRQLVTESLVLAVAGGGAGLVAAYFLFGTLARMVALTDDSFQMSFGVSPVALAFTAGVTLLAALLFGVLPAWQSTKSDAGAALKEQSRSAAGSIGRMRWGRLLVSAQLAMSLPLLVCAGLLAQTFFHLEHVDLGYPAEGLLQVQIDPREAGYDPVRRDALLRDLLEALRGIRGVEHASFAHNGVFTGSRSGRAIEVEGYAPTGQGDSAAGYDMVAPDYFATVGVPIRFGRGILDSDRAESPSVAVINEAFARRFFAGRNPIGMHFSSLNGNEKFPHAIVGVAGDARTSDVRGEVQPRYFLPATQPYDPANVRANLLLRVSGEPGPVLAAARREIQARDATLPIQSAVTVEEKMLPFIAQERMTAQLAVVFGLVALALAAIGLYGVLSYGVARRESEIAIRMALGAHGGRVVRMILRETSGVVVVGLAGGAALAYGATRMIQSSLFGVAPQDPWILGLAVAVLVGVALGAAYLPASRAARTDPITALRSE